jgi:NADH pyrophosphatase NudC (nudix superfamily)
MKKERLKRFQVALTDLVFYAEQYGPSSSVVDYKNLLTEVEQDLADIQVEEYSNVCHKCGAPFPTNPIHHFCGKCGERLKSKG